MKFIDKLERKFGNRGIENLTIYIIVSYVLGYALMFLNPELLSMLTLNVTQILHGQIWRLITWVIYPPTTTNLFLFIIVIVCFYYPVSSSLEHTWGSFKFTLYILSGILFTVISAFILYFITGGVSDVLNGQPFTTYYISLSVFLAYAMTYPEMKILLYFVIPIKMKWMALFYVLIVGWNVVSYVMNGAWFMALPIVASLLNFIIFFLGSNRNRFSPKQARRRTIYQKKVHVASQNNTHHRCAICGRTEKDDENLEFRFCSKCKGNYEYCQDHLFTHEHRK